MQLKDQKKRQLKNTFEEKLLLVCDQYNKFNIENPYESTFVYIVEKNKLLENPNHTLISSHVKKLLEEAIDADVVKIKDVSKLYSILFAPRRLIIKDSVVYDKPIDKEKLEFVSKQSVKTILK